MNTRALLKTGTQNEAPINTTPNTSKKKNRLSRQLTSFIQETEFNKEDNIDAITLTLKY